MQGNWLLCDFHIHTRFSDGELDLSEIVSLYGEHGFDVISVTDHIVDDGFARDFRARHGRTCFIEADGFPDYLGRLWKEARRAWETYGMLLIPGAEITNNTDGYHILGVDLKGYVDPGLSVESIVEEVHGQGGITVACHPHRQSPEAARQLTYLWDNHERFAHLFDAWEVANRDDLFNVVGLRKFNYVANSDFHVRRHLYSWKTLLRCEKNPEAVKSALRENRSVSIYLFREDKPLARPG